MSFGSGCFKGATVMSHTVKGTRVLRACRRRGKPFPPRTPSCAPPWASVRSRSESIRSNLPRGGFNLRLSLRNHRDNTLMDRRQDTGVWRRESHHGRHERGTCVENEGFTLLAVAYSARHHEAAGAHTELDQGKRVP